MIFLIHSKKLLGAGNKSGLVLSALEYLGKEEAEDEKLQIEIAEKLNSKEKLDLEKAAQAYPKWLREIVERIVE